MSMVFSIQSILHLGRSPEKLQTDKGTEFLNRNFQSLLKENSIHFFTTNSELKASVVERFNRTLKTRTWKTSNFLTKLTRTLQLDGEWEVGLAEIDYSHTWYNIREGKNSVEIYVPDKWFKKISIQPGYYEQVQDVIDALLKAGPANATDVAGSYDDTSKRVTVRCAEGTVLELRGNIARMFGYLDNTVIRASDNKT